MIKDTLIPKKNVTGEEEVPRCRRQCSSVPNPSFPGAGKHPLQKVFWKGVNSFSSDTLFS